MCLARVCFMQTGNCERTNGHMPDSENLKTNTDKNNTAVNSDNGPPIEQKQHGCLNLKNASKEINNLLLLFGIR